MLDDVGRLADRSISFVNFLTTCRKFGCILLYIFHDIAASSPRWRDILSQTQIFCIFLSAASLVINHSVNFFSPSKVSYISKQQIWLTKLFQELGNQTSYSCLCIDIRPQSLGEAKYRSEVENLIEQFCYLNTSTSDKMFSTFKSKQTDNIEKAEFLIQKQVGITKAGDRYEIEPKRDGESNGRHGVKQQKGGGTDQVRECRKKQQSKIFMGNQTVLSFI